MDYKLFQALTLPLVPFRCNIRAECSLRSCHPPLAPMLLNSCPRYYHHTHASNRQRENTTHHTLQLHLHLNLAQHKILLPSTTNVKAVVWQSTFQCSFPPHSHSLPSSWDMDWIKLDLAEFFFPGLLFYHPCLLCSCTNSKGKEGGREFLHNVCVISDQRKP